MRTISIISTCFIFTILFNSHSYSQNFYLNKIDSNIIFLAVQTGHNFKLTSGDLYAFDDIHSYKIFTDTNEASGIDNIEGFDFSSRTLVLLNYRGVDCHSRFNISLVKNEEKKLYDIVVGVIYGGCRAGGRLYSNWISIPRLPYGYTLQSTRQVIDNESEILE